MMASSGKHSQEYSRKSWGCSVVKTFCFVVALVLCLSAVSGVLKFKDGDGIEGPQLLRSLPDDSVDVLFVGSSRVFENVNTGVLWSDYGIAGFDLAGSVQPLWNTYYSLKEALETQHPQLVVLECFRAQEANEYVDNARIVKNTFGLAPSWNKLQDKMASAGEDVLLDYVMEFPLYHTRYSNLTRQDFLPGKGMPNRDAWKGHGVNTTTGRLDAMPDVSGVTERKELTAKSLEYLEKIVELCESKGIELVLIVAPANLSAAEQAVYNSVSDFAAERGIPFLNFNLMYDEVGMDFVSESSDLAPDNHLNHRGAAKFTRYLADWLKQNYGLPDRREAGEEWESWSRDSFTVRSEMADQGIRDAASLESWVYQVNGNRNRITVGLTVEGSAATDETVLGALSGLAEAGFDVSAIPAEGASFILREGNVEELALSAGSVGSQLVEKLWSATLLMRATGEGTCSLQLGIDKYNVAENGVTAFVYDNVTGKTVECVQWTAGSYSAKKTCSLLNPAA